MKLRAIVLLRLLALTTFTPSIVTACVCTWSVPEAIKYAEHIFSGEVIGITTDETQYPHLDSVSLVVEDRWRGAEADTFVVIEQGNTSCSVRFEVGEEYLVLATLRNGEPVTSDCHYSGPLAESGNVLEELGDPVVPVRRVKWATLKSRYGSRQ